MKLLDLESYPHLRGLQIADSCLATASSPEIGILIGANHYCNVFNDEIRRGNEGQIAFDAKFGWVVSGPVEGATSGSNVSTTHLIIAREEDSFIQNNPYQKDNKKTLGHPLYAFWEVKSIGIQSDDITKANKKEFLRGICTIPKIVTK